MCIRDRDLFDQSLLLDMIILGTHQLCGGVNIFFFYKVSFEKHPSVHSPVVAREDVSPVLVGENLLSLSTA